MHGDDILLLVFACLIIGYAFGIYHAKQVLKRIIDKLIERKLKNR